MKPAIAMVELIFAIVIIGISIMSIPGMMYQATSSSIVAFGQESIAISASHISALMSYAWDENNTGINEGKVLNVTNGDTDLAQQSGTLVRSGVTKFPNARRRQFASTTPSVFASTNLTLDSSDTAADDVDDFNNRTLSLVISSSTLNTASQGDYIDKNVTLDTSIVYAADDATYNSTSNSGFAFSFAPSNIAASASTTNIKFISVRLTTNNSDSQLRGKDILLHAFMCNIGSVSPENKGGF